MSVASSLGGIGQTAVGETLGPEFAKLASALQSTTKGLQGWNSALANSASALKGFASAGSASGSKPLSQSLELLASTVGVVVTPGIVLFGATIASVSALLMGDLEPALDDVAQWYADHVGALEDFGQGIVNAARAVEAFVGWLNKSRDPRADQDSNTRAFDFTGPIGLFAHLGDLWEQADREHGLEQRRLAGGHGQNQFGAGGGPAPPGIEAWDKADNDNRAAPLGIEAWDKADKPDKRPEGVRDLMPGMLKGIIAGMKQDQGAAPGFSNIADAWRQAQMSTFENPMQAMIRKNWDKTITVLDKIATKIEDQNQAPNAVQGGNGRAGR